MPLRPIRRLLIANRGEIAVRVIRTCRELGITPIAVFSEADASALHVRLADEAYPVGPAASAESYLRQDRVLEVAQTADVDAIHPGYGFLSENADFAEACEAAGILFVGPPASAIRAMGDKTAARKLMRQARVPMAPGTIEPVSDPEEAERAVRDIGLPVLIKAAAGGGGKGMRTVASQNEISAALRQAQSEAQSAFGDGRVYIEKLLVGPRHIEFQVLADEHGNVVHLFERECSIQRRHQKVIEEAPSALLGEELRAAMGEAAIQAARACGYVGAGTVEFLVDQDGNFYFLEMNTRLQVEHPVTEMITGIDLVAEQIAIARGEPLRFGQSDLRMQGHAVEARVYAEDVGAGFLPNPGPLVRHSPAAGPFVRVDAGVEQGDVIPMHYDPMIAKLIAWGRTRTEAIDRLHRALEEYDVAGVQTTIPFCRFVMKHPAFRMGEFDTGFISQHFGPEALRSDTASDAFPHATAAALEIAESGQQVNQSPNGTAQLGAGSAWRRRRLAGR